MRLKAFGCLLASLPIALSGCTITNPPPLASPSVALQREGIKDEAAAKIVLLLGIILVTLSLASCALYRPNMSWVDEMDAKDATVISGAIAALIVNKIPADKALQLLPPPAAQANNQLTANLIHLLQTRGYSVADADDASAPSHRLCYFVSSREGGYVLRLQLNDIEASAIFTRGTNGELLASGTLSVRDDRL